MDSETQTVTEETLNYSTYNGTKLEYAETANGDRTQIKGLLKVPDIGGEPNSIDTTTLDNTRYETAKYGLMPAVKLPYEYNLEDPSATANIKLASDLEDSKKTYYWWLTLPNGIVLSYQSAVITDIKGGGSGDLIKFGMYHNPIKEIERTIPTT